MSGFQAVSKWFEPLALLLVAAPFWLTMLLKVTFLLSLAWLVHLGLKRHNPRWRVLLWRSVFVGIFILPLVAFSLPAYELNIFERKTITAVAPEQPGSNSNNYSTIPLVNNTSSISQTLPETLIAKGDLFPAEPSNENRLGVFWMAIKENALFVFYLSITAFLILQFGLSRRKLKRLAQLSRPAPQQLQETCQKVLAELNSKRNLSVRIVDDLPTPILTGLFKPVLLLPAHMVEAYRSEWPMIFAHEAAHLRSRDLWWSSALHVVSIALWFHPLAWRIRAKHAEACEEVSDATAAFYMGDVEVYSRTLARIAIAAASTPPAAGGIPFARVSDITRRLDLLKRKLFTAQLSIRQLAIFLFCSFLILVVLGSVEFTYAITADDLDRMQVSTNLSESNVQTQQEFKSYQLVYLEHADATTIARVLEEQYGKIHLSRAVKVEDEFEFEDLRIFVRRIEANHPYVSSDDVIQLIVTSLTDSRELTLIEGKSEEVNEWTINASVIEPILIRPGLGSAMIELTKKNAAREYSIKVLKEWNALHIYGPKASLLTTIARSAKELDRPVKSISIQTFSVEADQLKCKAYIDKHDFPRQLLYPINSPFLTSKPLYGFLNAVNLANPKKPLALQLHDLESNGFLKVLPGPHVLLLEHDWGEWEVPFFPFHSVEDTTVAANKMTIRIMPRVDRRGSIFLELESEALKVNNRRFSDIRSRMRIKNGEDIMIGDWETKTEEGETISSAIFLIANFIHTAPVQEEEVFRIPEGTGQKVKVILEAVLSSLDKEVKSVHEVRFLRANDEYDDISVQGTPQELAAAQELLEHEQLISGIQSGELDVRTSDLTNLKLFEDQGADAHAEYIERVKEVIETTIYSQTGKTRAAKEGRRLWVNDNHQLTIVDHSNHLLNVEEYLAIAGYKLDKIKRDEVIFLKYADAKDLAGQIEDFRAGPENTLTVDMNDNMWLYRDLLLQLTRVNENDDSFNGRESAELSVRWPGSALRNMVIAEGDSQTIGDYRVSVIEVFPAEVKPEEGYGRTKIKLEYLGSDQEQELIVDIFEDLNAILLRTENQGFAALAKAFIESRDRQPITQVSLETQFLRLNVDQARKQVESTDDTLSAFLGMIRDLENSAPSFTRLQSLDNLQLLKQFGLDLTDLTDSPLRIQLRNLENQHLFEVINGPHVLVMEGETAVFQISGSGLPYGGARGSKNGFGVSGLVGGPPGDSLGRMRSSDELKTYQQKSKLPPDFVAGFGGGISGADFGGQRIQYISHLERFITPGYINVNVEYEITSGMKLVWKLSSKVSMQDGETVLLGGWLPEQLSDSERSELKNKEKERFVVLVLITGNIIK